MNPRYLVAVFLWCLLSTGFQMLAMERPGMDSLAVAGSSNASASRGSRLTSPVANARAVGDEDTVGLLEAEFDCPGHQCSNAAGPSGYGAARSLPVFPAAVPTAHVTPGQLEAQTPAPQHGWFRRCIKCVFSPSEYKRRLHDVVNYFRNMEARKRGRWGLACICLADIAGEIYIAFVNPYYEQTIIVALATFGSIAAKHEGFKWKMLGSSVIASATGLAESFGLLPSNILTPPAAILFAVLSGAKDLVKKAKVTGTK